MNEDRSIAVIGLPTLVAVGLKSMIGSGRHQLRVVTYQSFQDFKSFEENVEGYIISAEVFASSLDYFMPRKKNVLIYGDFHSPVGENMIPVLGHYDDETVIGEKILSLSDRINSEGVERGELSSREKDVLRLLVSGKINKEIADELCISINTVITHRKNITEKTGIKSVSGLSIYALMNGIS